LNSRKESKRKKVFLSISIIFLLLFTFNIATIIFPNIAFAEETTEEETTSETPKVDMDCDKFDFTCKIQEFLLDAVQGAINFTVQQLDLFIVKPNEILEEPVIAEFYGKAYDFFAVLLTVIFLYKMVEILAVADPEASRGIIREKLVRLGFTAAFAYGFEWIFKGLVKMNNSFVQGILDGYSLTFSTFKYEDTKLSESLINVTFMIILMIILAILFLVLLIQMAIRYAELGFSFAIAPIIIATNLSDNFNLLPGFWRNLMSIIFTQGVQILLILFMTKFFANGSMWEIDKIMYGIGYMILVVKSPHVVKELMYSSGTGSAVTGMSAGAVRTVVQAAAFKKVK
jgi:hypothetical protein